MSSLFYSTGERDEDAKFRARRSTREEREIKMELTPLPVFPAVQHDASIFGMGHVI
ncbi:hypothetical protein Hdeb2414_s0021g00572881 [Helianthus debilis subsp. tardiflorus]